MLSKTIYKPGVIKDDTQYASAGYAVDSDKIRYVRGRPESQAGYEDQLAGVKLDGIGRTLFAWTDTQGITYEAVGTNSKLYVVSEGAYYDVTPLYPADDGTGTATSAGGPTVTVTSALHGLRNGSYVYMQGTPTTAIGGTGAFGVDPFFTQEGVQLIKATLVNHGFKSGDLVTIAGAVAFNGITDLNGQKTVFVTDPDTFTFMSDLVATGSGSGGGAGATYSWFEGFEVTIVDENTFTIQNHPGSVYAAQAVTWFGTLPAGRVDSVNLGGYSTGPYSVDRFGYSLSAIYRSDYQARTWALDNLGTFLVANPIGGGVYMWKLNTSTRAEIVPNAPTRNDYMIVTEEGAIMVFGTINTDAVYDPMVIRWSDIRTSITGTTTWETWTPAPGNLSGEYRLSVGSYLVGAQKTKDGIGIWSDTAFFFSQFVPNVDIIYSFSLIATGCGLAGPNASIEKDGMLYWMTMKVGFHSYDSGSPSLLACPVRRYVMDSINVVQAAKVWCAYDAAYDGVTWAYPVSSEVDRYVRLDVKEVVDANSGWSIGSTDMTAWVDRNPIPFPTAYRVDGMLTFQDKGRSANGDVIERFVEYAPVEIDGDGAIAGTYVLNVSKVVFDATCEGDIDCEIRLRRWPNAPDVIKGPYPQTSSTQYTGVRGQGRQAGFLWRSFGYNDFWRLGDIRYDISQGPRR